MKRWRGLKKLVHEAVDHTTDLVEETHESVARKTMRYFDFLGPLALPARAVDGVRRVTTAGVFATIHGVNHAVELVTDEGIDLVDKARGDSQEETTEDFTPPMRSDATGSLPWIGDAALGAVNGVIGDYLHSRGNGLDLGMTFRFLNRHLPLDSNSLRETLPEVTPKVVVFVHGLSCTEWSWCLGAEEYYGDPSVCFGDLLQRDLGFTPFYVRYNTGRHISDNGQLLADRLDMLLNAYPIEVDELVLIGHSMGGLVTRSACNIAKQRGQRWLGSLSRVVCIASPHSGAPLEKFGNVVSSVLRFFDTPGTQIPAKVIDVRSAGIKDLRFGYLSPEDWEDQHPDALLENNRHDVPLLDEVVYCFLAATITNNSEHPVGYVLGDMLVRVPSATEPANRREAFHIEAHHFGGISHLHTQNHPDVYEQVKRFCAGEVDEG